jgi:type II secretion system protein G
VITRFARLRRSQEGFTLIELLVVVAIIALLATFAVPKLFDAINKSKKAPGQADVQTIAGSLDRYYMDKNAYPTAANGSQATIKNALTQNGYLKTTTTFYNGYEKGYIYVSDNAGGFYVFVDAQKKDPATNMTLQCGTANHEFTVNTVNKDLNVYQVGGAATDISAADVQQGCRLGTGTGATFAPLVANSDGTPSYTIVTN